jgi:hypothetical protein
MRLSLTKAAHAFPSSAAKQEIRVRSGPTARHFPNSVPQRRLNSLNLAQDVGPGFDLRKQPSPVGTTENHRELSRMPDWAILSRPFGTSYVGLINPGLTSWAKFRRPCGTGFGK